MWRKFAQYLSEFFGYMIGWPIDFLYANAAIVRTFERIRVMWRSIARVAIEASPGSTPTATSTIADSTAIGWLVGGKPAKKWCMSSWISE